MNAIKSLYPASEDVVKTEGGDCFDVDVIENQDGEAVCYAVVYNGEHENTRVFSAAFELLDSLERLFEHTAMVHNRWGEDGNTEEANLAIWDARAAIKKARGE